MNVKATVTIDPLKHLRNAREKMTKFCFFLDFMVAIPQKYIPIYIVRKLDFIIF